MNIKFITAQAFGVVALIFLFLSFKKNEKKYLIKMQAFSSISYALQYLFLGAYTGFIMHLLCILRNYFYNSYSYKNKIPFLVFIQIATLMILCSMLTYSGLYSLLTTVGILIYTYGLWQKNMKVTRVSEAIATLLCIIYNFFVKAYTGNIAMGLELLFVIAAIYKYDIKKTNN